METLPVGIKRVCESIFPELLNNIENNEALYKLISFVGISILVILALILFWEVWTIFHIRFDS